MDTRQLQETGRQLSKAFDGGDPASTLLTLLSPLEKWTPTEEALRASKIGVAVAKVRASKDPKVAGLASQLVNKWKAAVKKKPQGAAGVGAGGKAAAGAGANGVVNGRSGTSSPAPGGKKEVVAAAPKKFSVAPEKRTAKEDGVDTAVTGTPARDACVLLIYNGLVYMSEEQPSDILAVARDVEKAAYDQYWAADSQQTQYKQKMRSLFSNLKMKTSEALRRDVFSGAIEPKRFVTMSTEELKSEDKRKEDNILQKENMNKAMTAQEERAISTTYVPLAPTVTDHHTTAISRRIAWKEAQDLILHPLYLAYLCWQEQRGAGYEVFFAFSTSYPSTLPPYLSVKNISLT